MQASIDDVLDQLISKACENEGEPRQLQEITAEQANQQLALMQYPSPDEGGLLYLDITERPQGGKFADLAIEKILKHRKRGAKMMFTVVFKGFSQKGQSVELLELERDHPSALADYIIYLEAEKPKSYQPLIKSFPRLLKLIKN